MAHPIVGLVDSCAKHHSNDIFSGRILPEKSYVPPSPPTISNSPGESSRRISLIYSVIDIYSHMARASTTTDVFNAIAELHRRRILSYLKGGEKSVSDIVGAMGLSQPQISKHLRVLRDVGLVSSRTAGQQRYYSLDAENLKPVALWIRDFEQFWNESFDKLEIYLSSLHNRNEE